MWKRNELNDIKPNLSNTDDCPYKANVILANIKRTVLSLEINQVFMELLLALF